MNKSLDLQELQQNRYLLDKFNINYQKLWNFYMYKNEDFMIYDWVIDEIERVKNHCRSEVRLYKLENTNLLIYYCCLVSLRYNLLGDVPF